MWCVGESHNAKTACLDIDLKSNSFPALLPLRDELAARTNQTLFGIKQNHPVIQQRLFSLYPETSHINVLRLTYTNLI